MNYEKAYKDALERARQFSEHPLQEDSGTIVEYIFPELKESEDERTRKEFCEDIWTFIPNEKAHKYIAWLEKQGEKSSIRERYDKIKDSEWFKKTHEEKIEQKKDMNNKLTDVNHEYFSEVLENNDCENINDYAYQVAYCMSHDWIAETATWDDVQKACKLGAEWNEKHHKSAWSEEDDAYKLFAISAVEDYYDGTNPLQKELVNWLKSLKDRVQPKQEWSEDDKIRLDCICKTLWKNRKGDTDEIYQQEQDIDWLKQLKQRM